MSTASLEAIAQRLGPIEELRGLLRSREAEVFGGRPVKVQTSVDEAQRTVDVVFEEGADR